MKKPRVCTSCNRSAPDVEFYDYTQWGGVERTRCKECVSIKNKESYRLMRVRDVRPHIDRIAGMDKRQRFSAALALYRKEVIAQGDLRVLLKSVEF